MNHSAVYFSSDTKFNQLYSQELRNLAGRHWTPLAIIRLATEFLVNGKPENSRVLDIGSGAGKFCLAAGYYYPGYNFTGVEIRKNLVEESDRVRDKLGFNNVNFILQNVELLDLRSFNHFYFYNSFFENLEPEGSIDSTLPLGKEQYIAYVQALYWKFKALPRNTRIVTYHSDHDEIPACYRLTESLEEDTLHFWVKKD